MNLDREHFNETQITVSLLMSENGSFEQDLGLKNVELRRFTTLITAHAKKGEIFSVCIN